MEAQSFLLYLQEPTICPYREPQESNAKHPIQHKIHFNIILQFLLISSKLYLSFCFPTKSLHTFLFSPIRATCPTHLLLYNLITTEMFGEDSKPTMFSVCNFLNFPVTLSSLDPNISLSTLNSHVLSLPSSHNARYLH